MGAHSLTPTRKAEIAANLVQAANDATTERQAAIHRLRNCCAPLAVTGVGFAHELDLCPRCLADTLKLRGVA